MEPRPDDPVLAFATAAAFERWLAAHHATATVVWIKHAKKGSGIASITWTEAVDVVLCFGWIDGQSRSLDATHFLQRYTPRRPKSLWAKLNRERVARLIEAGRMRPAGLAEVARAQADGRWDGAYDSPKTAAVPADLARALAADAAAATAFAALTATQRYSILHRLQTAREGPIRTRRLAVILTTLVDGPPGRAVPAPPPATPPKARTTAKPAPRRAARRP